MLTKRLALAPRFATMNPVKHLLAFLALVVSSVGLLSSSASGGTKRRLPDNEIWDANITRPFNTIDARDGIDELEANYLAQWYFLMFGGLCGYAAPVEKEDVWWTAQAVVGLRGTDVGPIKIHQKLGIITWAGGEWMAPPWVELEAFIDRHTPPQPVQPVK